MTMLTRWNAGNRLLPAALGGFEDLFRSVLTRMTDVDPEWLSGHSGLTSVDLEVGEEEVTVKLPVPGCNADEIELEMTGDLLTVRAERVEEKKDEEKENRFIRRERSTFHFEETVKLPVKVVGGESSALYEDGVLTVTLPREKDDTDKTYKVKVD